MQSIQLQQQSIMQYTIAKIEESFLKVEQEIEFVFTKIDESIDSISLIPFKFEILQLQSQFRIPEYGEFSVNEFIFTTQILESVNPLIHQIIQNKIGSKQQNLNRADDNLQKVQQKNNHEEEQMNKKINLVEEVIDSQQITQYDSICMKGNQENDTKKQKEVIQVEFQQKQFEQQLMINKQIELKLIDDSNQQSGYCYAIVFDKTGEIMISCENGMIKIWKFEQGRLKLINTYQKHKEAVTCLVYSKLINNFISGSYDNTIICWQQINQKQWKCSQPFQQHNKHINCLMLNKQENQLISGGQDKSIKVWNVDFIKNELTFQYSLDRHSISVQSFSFNSSETVLVSCGYHHFIIWEKGVQGKWEFKYIIEQSEYLYLLLTHLLHLIEFIIQKVRFFSIFQMNFNISISFCIHKLFQIMDVRYIQLMINNFFGQLLIRMLIIFQYLNYRIESSNRILIKLSN